MFVDVVLSGGYCRPPILRAGTVLYPQGRMAILYSQEKLGTERDGAIVRTPCGMPCVRSGSSVAFVRINIVTATVQY